MYSNLIMIIDHDDSACVRENTISCLQRGISPHQKIPHRRQQPTIVRYGTFSGTQSARGNCMDGGSDYLVACTRRGNIVFVGAGEPRGGTACGLTARTIFRRYFLLHPFLYLLGVWGNKIRTPFVDAPASRSVW